jgi:hypothetical protein
VCRRSWNLKFLIPAASTASYQAVLMAKGCEGRRRERNTRAALSSASFGAKQRNSSMTCGSKHQGAAVAVLGVVQGRLAALEVDVAPAQAEQLAAARAGGDGHQHQQEEARPGRRPAGGEQALALGLGEVAHAPARLGALFHQAHRRLEGAREQTILAAPGVEPAEGDVELVDGGLAAQSGLLLAEDAIALGLARPARLELTTPGLEGRCSIRLSYGRLSIGHATFGRGERIRTSDILVPNQARYRAALHPEDAAFYSGTPHRSIESKCSEVLLATPPHF